MRGSNVGRSVRAGIAALLLSLAALPGFAAPPANGAAAGKIDALLAADERPDAASARQLVAQGALLLDVRSLDEWNAGHAKGARFLPHRSVDDRAAGLIPDKDTPIVTYCAAGVRAAAAANSLRSAGYKHVVAMKGGFQDLQAAGQPVEK